MIAPKLRFKGFEENWTKVNIQTLVDEKIIDKPMDGNHGEIHPTSADYVENGIPFIMATDVTDGKVYLDKSKKIKQIQADKLRKGFSVEGDILLTHKATIGNVAKVPTLNTPYIMLTPQVTYYRTLKKDKLSPDFIKSTFEAPVFQNELLGLCTGATRLYIGISEQRKLPFSYPSIKEQTKIATFLSAVDEKIAQLSQKLHLLGQYKQGMMQKLFSQKIRFKADDGSDFGEWKETNLISISEIIMGSSPKSENYNENSIGLPLLQGNADIKNRKSAPRLHTSEITKTCNMNDILLSVRAPVGFVAISEHIACIGRGLCAIRAKKEYSQDFLYQWLLNHEKSWVSLSQGSTFDSVNSEQIKRLCILVPCLEEQTKIANFLSAIDQKIDVVAEQLEQAKTWKKGLLQQMFV